MCQEGWKQNAEKVFIHHVKHVRNPEVTEEICDVCAPALWFDALKV